MRAWDSHPCIDVMIGGQLRLYHAYVTTAPRQLDGSATVTLQSGTVVDVIGFAATPVPFESQEVHAPARIVLVEATELDWHRARARQGQYLFTPTDPLLIGLPALQQWLWQRLQEGREDGSRSPQDATDGVADDEPVVRRSR
jgi:hypothetical protein